MYHWCQPIAKRRTNQWNQAECKVSRGSLTLCPEKAGLTGPFFAFVALVSLSVKHQSCWVDKCVCNDVPWSLATERVKIQTVSPVPIWGYQRVNTQCSFKFSLPGVWFTKMVNPNLQFKKTKSNIVLCCPSVRAAHSDTVLYTIVYHTHRFSKLQTTHSGYRLNYLRQ